MKTAVCLVAYNEVDIIAASIEHWKGCVDKVLVLVSSRPWHGVPAEYDGTVEVAKKHGADVIVQYWKDEAEQRNFGLAVLYDYDYVIIADPDEFYEDTCEVLGALDGEPCYRVEKMKTYWKTTDFIFEPGDKHKPIIAVDPKRIKFSETRQPMPVCEPVLQQHQPIIGVTMHHISWAKTDEKVLEKIQSYSHSKDIPDDWYERVWKNWQAGLDNIRPYGVEKSRAVLSPIPKNIRDLLTQYGNVP